MALGATSLLTSAVVTACDDGGGEAEEEPVDLDEVPWATGGTKSMTRQADYPNPFENPTTMCLVMCDLERGPCYSNQSEIIRDISYGEDGLPMRMGFRLVDARCQPQAGLEVMIWHANTTGSYSGNDEEHMDVDFCTSGNEDYKNNLFFRGRQITDDDGIVYFDTCMPSFYGIRVTHIHMIIRIDGQLYATLELCLPDRLIDELAQVHPAYISRGRPVLVNADDVVFSQADDYLDYELETQKLPDGALLAWKTLVLRDKADVACKFGGGPWDDQST